LGFQITGIANRLPEGVLDAGNTRRIGCTRQIRDIARVIVLKPALSISRCTSPTDQLQIGQAGTSKTTSTASSFRLRISKRLLPKQKWILSRFISSESFK
jgi:hypothetical protein